MNAESFGDRKRLMDVAFENVKRKSKGARGGDSQSSFHRKVKKKKLSKLHSLKKQKHKDQATSHLQDTIRPYIDAVPIS